MLLYQFTHEEIWAEVKQLASCEQVEGLQFQCRLFIPSSTRLDTMLLPGLRVPDILSHVVQCGTESRVGLSCSVY